MWMYFNAFRISRMGNASAIGVVMFLITLVATILNMPLHKVPGILTACT